MTSYSVSKTIGAPAERVWSILTDASRYTDWNPTIVSLDGTIAEGETIALVSTVNPKRTFKLKVSDVTAPTSMVWSDGMPLGLFTGARTFTVTPREDGGSEFTMEEVYTGALAGLITRSIPDMTDSFEEFATGLKQEAESPA
ncbi:MAG: SRPBCC domain-containing protein [Acidimicrobiia bacterium]|nr:SRPBCC domain-containing protein [Acidimicrobiia bacterium]